MLIVFLIKRTFVDLLRILGVQNKKIFAHLMTNFKSLCNPIILLKCALMFFTKDINENFLYLHLITL